MNKKVDDAMFFYKYIILYIAMIIMTGGCGTTNSYKTDSIVTLNETSQILDDTKVNKALEIIKHQGNVKKIYLSKDRHSAYVFKVIDDYFYGYQNGFLLKYDISNGTPTLTDEIESSVDLGQVLVLHDGKIAYPRNRYQNEYDLVIYDSYKKQIIRKYSLYYTGTDIPLFKTDSKENYIFVDNFKLHIEDIYQENYISSDILFDYDDYNIIDPVNNLIWQNDNIVFANTLTEAISICKNKPGYNWRLPTEEDVLSYSNIVYKNDTSLKYGIDIFQPVEFYTSYVSHVSYWLLPVSDSEYTLSYNHSNGSDNFDYTPSPFQNAVRCVAEWQR
jgi:hypothetical protein